MTEVVKGVRLGVAQAGIKTADTDDVVLIGLGANTQTAAVFTQNAFRAAPVQLAESHLEAIAGQAAFLLVNTGNANAGTGAQGVSDAERCCSAVAEQA